MTTRVDLILDKVYPFIQYTFENLTRKEKDELLDAIEKLVNTGEF